MSMTPKLWSISALSVELGMDRRTVAKKIAAVKPAEEGSSGKLYRLADVLQAMATAAVADQRPADFEDAKTRKMTADAVLAEIEVAKVRGQVVDVDVMAKAVAGDYALVRARLLALPTKLTPLVVPMTDPAEVRDTIERAVAEALEELTVDRDLGGPGDTGSDLPGGLGERASAGSEAPAEADGQRMGGPVPPAKRGGKRRTRPVGDGTK